MVKPRSGEEGNRPRLYHFEPKRSATDLVARRLGLDPIAQLQEPAGLDLANALAGQVHDLTDLLERDAALLGDVERARVRQLVDLFVGEVELDRARLQVVAADCDREGRIEEGHQRVAGIGRRQHGDGIELGDRGQA